MKGPVAFAQALVRCESVTPHEGGALGLIETMLNEAGFCCRRLVFSASGYPDIDNLYARIGSGAPHLMFAGHTDVVPPGDAAAWRHPPFGATIEDGVLYGRGASDMKGGIACFIAAMIDFLGRRGDDFAGSISLLITGDEEGPAVNGTRRVLDWMRETGERPDHCLLGEPTSPDRLGEAIKIGRRGSLNATLTIHGRQGHVAYQKRALNPVPAMAAALTALKAKPLDAGSDHFEASNLEVTSVDVGNPAENVIPAKIAARFNARFNDLHSGESLRAEIRRRIETALAGTDARFDLVFSLSGESYVTQPGALVETMRSAVRDVLGVTPALSTDGGISDARFIKDLCPVIEFGLTSATIHQVDECASVADIESLTAIYARFLERYFAPRA
jgi:succinyl-diaminopimelate desuccinylase